MDVVDLSENPRLGILLEMLSEVSRANRPIDVLAAFARRYWTIRPIDYFLTVSVRGLDPGRYRVTRQINAAEILSGRLPIPASEPWSDWTAAPVHEGGLIGELIADSRPKLVHNLSREDDPVLGSVVAGLGSCITLPLYDRGEVLGWTIQFRRAVNGFSVAELEDGLVVSNLVGSTNRMLLLYGEVRELHDALQQQLEDVARVQRSLLPPRIPEIPGLEIATSYLTSDRAGGDYYDFLPMADGRWAILIADVSGHGAAAATVMAMLHGILHACISQGQPPDAVLRQINRRLVEAGLEGNFVTAFLAVYDPGAGVLHYSRCGHNPPRLKEGASGAVRVLDGAGSLPLGVFEPYEVASTSIRLRPRDTVVLYTDGITEAFNTERSMFGAAGLDEALAHCEGAPDCVVDSVHTALYRHTGARTRADDQTLVAIRYHG